jgi:hypothetical protein
LKPFHNKPYGNRYFLTPEISLKKKDEHLTNIPVKQRAWFAALTIGMMEWWNNGIMGWRPSDKSTPAAKRGN